MRHLVLLLALLAGGSIAAAPTVTADRDHLVLGDEAPLVLTVTPDPAHGAVHAQASGGSLIGPAGAGQGRISFTWSPPDVKHPSTAVIVVWQQGKDLTPAVLRVPLHGRTILEMTTEPNAEVRVRVGEEEFGPVVANRKGSVSVPVVVPPGVTQAEVLATSKGQQTTRTVPLDVPISTPIAAAITPDPIPSRSGGHLVVAHGPEVDPGSLVVQASGVSIAEDRRLPGAVLFRITPEPGETDVIIAVEPKGDPTARVGVGATIVEEPEPPLEVVEVPEPTPEPAPAPAWTPAVLVGGFFGGGQNLGLWLELSTALPYSLLGGRLTPEVGVGIRTSGLSAPLAGAGTLEASLLAVPITAGARFRLLHLGALELHARGGIGAVPFRHGVVGAQVGSRTELGLGFDAFVAAQAGWGFGPVELLFELRGSYASASTPRIRANPGGLSAGLGLRYPLR